MQIYVNAYYLLMAASGIGGFLVGRYILTRKLAALAESSVKAYYRDLYNEQMNELIIQYRQERAAMAHRYGGLIHELETEIQVIRSAMDSDRTSRVFVERNEEVV